MQIFKMLMLTLVYGGIVAVNLWWSGHPLPGREWVNPIFQGIAAASFLIWVLAMYRGFRNQL